MYPACLPIDGHDFEAVHSTRRSHEDLFTAEDCLGDGAIAAGGRYPQGRVRLALFAVELHRYYARVAFEPQRNALRNPVRLHDWKSSCTRPAGNGTSWK